MFSVTSSQFIPEQEQFDSLEPQNLMNLPWLNKYVEEFKNDKREISELKAAIELEKAQYNGLQSRIEEFTAESKELEERCSELETHTSELEQKLVSEKGRYDFLDEVYQNPSVYEEQLKAMAQEIMTGLIETMNEGTNALAEELQVNQTIVQSNDLIIAEQQKLIESLQRTFDLMKEDQEQFLQMNEAARVEIQEQYKLDKNHYLELLISTENEIAKMAEEFYANMNFSSIENSEEGGV